MDIKTKKRLIIEILFALSAIAFSIYKAGWDDAKNDWFLFGTAMDSYSWRFPSIEFLIPTLLIVMLVIYGIRFSIWAIKTLLKKNSK